MDNDNKIKNTETEIIAKDQNVESQEQQAEENLPETVSTELRARDFIPEEQVHNEVRMFLDNELSTLYQQSKLQSYNLEKEYAETKRHRSPLAWIVLGICFAVVLGTVVVMASVISSKERSIEVEMTVFDDLNLKDLLDSVAKIQDGYDDSVRRRSLLINDREVALRNAESKREQDIFIVKSTKLSSREERERINSIESDYNLTIQKIQTEYDPKITAIEAEIRDYENQLKEYNASKIQAAQEQERLLNSERRVQELERRKLAQQYEGRIEELERTIEDLRKSNSSDVYKSVSSLSSKYQAEIDGLDPKIVDRKAENIVDGTKSAPASNFNGAEAIENVSDYIVSSGFEKYQAAYDDYAYLNKMIAALPQKNTIPSYVSATKKLVNSMGETFTETTLALERDKSSLTNQVGNLKSTVSGLTNDYDNLVDEYNGLIDDYEGLEMKISLLKNQYEQEKSEAEQQFEQEKENLTQSLTEQFNAEKDKMNQEHSADKLAQRDYFEECINGIILSSKGMAAVISAESKDSIRIYVIPEIQDKIGSTETPAEIKAAKSIKGTIVKDGERYYKFVPAVDKNGEMIDFDLETVTSGLIVKLTVKK